MNTVQQALDSIPKIEFGMVTDSSVDPYMPSSVRVGARSQDFALLGPAAGLSSDALSFGQPVALLGGDRPLLLGVSPWITTSP